MPITEPSIGLSADGLGVKVLLIGNGDEGVGKCML